MRAVPIAVLSPWHGQAALLLLALAASAAVPVRAQLVPVGPEFQVNTYETGQQSGPAVAMDGLGGFVVVWDGPGVDARNKEVFAQRFDSAGTPLGLASR